jgi:hypothetical protein
VTRAARVIMTAVLVCARGQGYERVRGDRLGED